MAYTSGPWLCKPPSWSGDEFWIYRKINDEYNGSVALVDTKDDANLIAAAPELLEALEAALFTAKVYSEEGRGYRLGGHNIREIERVVAKAKGLTPSTT